MIYDEFALEVEVQFIVLPLVKLSSVDVALLFFACTFFLLLSEKQILLKIFPELQ